MARTLVEIEHIGAGEIGRVGKAGDRRQFRRRAGGDDEALRLHGEAVDRNGLAVGETRDALDDPHAHAGETLPRIERLDCGDHLLHARAHAWKIDAEAHGLDAKARSGAHRLRPLGGGNQRLRRQRTAIEGFTAEPAFFDEDDVAAEGGRGGSGREPARPRPDHANIRPDLLLDFGCWFGFLRGIWCGILSHQPAGSRGGATPIL